MGIRTFALALLVATGASFATFKKTSYENHLALNVIGVHPESGCFTAGMVAGDQIVGVQGSPLTDMSQIQAAIKNHKAGQKVKIEIARDGKKQTLNVALTERPDDISSLTGSAIGSKIASGPPGAALAARRSPCWRTSTTSTVPKVSKSSVSLTNRSKL